MARDSGTDLRRNEAYNATPTELDPTNADRIV